MIAEARRSIVGVDPGLSGGLAHLIETSGKLAAIVDVIPMPVFHDGKRNQFDRTTIIKWLAQANPERVLIEQVGSMPKQGIASTFNFGYGAGLIEGICLGLGIPVKLVTPQAWQSEVLKGYPKTEKGKSSVLFCSRMFPDHDWRGTERSRTPHDGKTDSCAIAFYGLSKNY